MNRLLPNTWRPLGMMAAVACLLAVPAIAAADDGKQDAPPARERTTGERTGQDAPPARGPRDRAGDRTPPARERGGPADDILRGPGVGGRDAAGRPFGSGPNRGMGQQAEIQIPPRLWFAQFRQAELTDEQRERFASLMDTHSGEVAIFDAEHGEKLRELERAARLARAEASDDAAESVVKLREQIDAIRAQAPKIEDVQKQAFDLLNDEQKTEMRERLNTVQTRLQAQAEQRRRAAAGQPGDRTRQRGSEMDGERPGRPAGRDGATPPQRGRDGATPPQRGRDGATPPQRGRDGATPPQRDPRRDGTQGRE